MNLNFKKPGDNILTATLTALKVKYTKKFSEKYFNEHPYKYNLLGISKMLWVYGIENAGVNILNKENNISFISTPFIAHMGTEFVLVENVDNKNVHYVWNKKKNSCKIKEFNQVWTGIALLMEPRKNAIEPNYKHNKNRMIFSRTYKYLLILMNIILFSYLYLYENLYLSIYLNLCLFLNIIGASVSLLLVFKHIDIHSSYSDKICSLLNHGNCNNVLESSAAKLWGIVSWSEIGISYFLSNIILMLLQPQLIKYLAIINVLTLPYSFWSTWYQKKIAQQWCTLCLIIQLCLWLMFLNSIIFDMIITPSLNLNEFLLLIFIYIIPFLSVSIFIHKLSDSQKIEKINYEINSLKANEDAFKAILKQQPFYQVSKSNSMILLGNVNSNILITVLTNPYCDPCSKMHFRIEKLLRDSQDKFCIQYILSSFNEELKLTNKYLIALYIQSGINSFQTILDDWFLRGKIDKNLFFNKYKFQIDSQKVMQEFELHEKWIQMTKLIRTPTILINGHQLPDNYQIEDLKYFIDFNIDIN